MLHCYTHGLRLKTSRCEYKKFKINIFWRQDQYQSCCALLSCSTDFLLWAQVVLMSRYNHSSKCKQCFEKVFRGIEYGSYKFFFFSCWSLHNSLHDETGSLSKLVVVSLWHTHASTAVHHQHNYSACCILTGCGQVMKDWGRRAILPDVSRFPKFCNRSGNFGLLSGDGKCHIVCLPMPAPVCLTSEFATDRALCPRQWRPWLTKIHGNQCLWFMEV